MINYRCSACGHLEFTDHTKAHSNMFCPKCRKRMRSVNNPRERKHYTQYQKSKILAEKRTKQIYCKVTETEFYQIHRFAQKAGISVSLLLHEAMKMIIEPKEKEVE